MPLDAPFCCALKGNIYQLYPENLAENRQS